MYSNFEQEKYSNKNYAQTCNSQQYLYRVVFQGTFACKFWPFLSLTIVHGEKVQINFSFVYYIVSGIIQFALCCGNYSFVKMFYYSAYKLPRMSSSVLSCSNMNGSRCGIVVFGACGLVHSFMLFKVGRSLASKLNALSVNFWRKTCHVADNL